MLDWRRKVKEEVERRQEGVRDILEEFITTHEWEN